ncbi:acyl carrier protein [Geobacter sp.]|uniref:acyl carrier protein n=1 Tax=Geobacter sp. TaxID=46610 RepID=UPI0027BA511E|nr:phosphopantetheine-binding protein [Geobacter sp.]
MTEEKLKEIIFRELRQIAPEADPTILDPDENIRQALDIDSYDFLQFLIAIDEAIGVDIPEADYENVFTLRGLLRYLEVRVG